MKDKEIIELIIRDENTGFKVIYDKFFDSSCGFMSKNGLHSRDEQKDMFQMAMVTLMSKLRKKDFILTSKLTTYINGIMINQCYKGFSHQSRFVSIWEGDEEGDIIEIVALIPEPHSFEKQVEMNEITQIINKELVGGRMEIIRLMYIEGKSQKEIAKELGYASTDSIKTQKYKGLKSLKTSLRKKYKDEELKYYVN